MLSSKQINSYRDKGYLVLENQVTESWLTRIRAALAEFESIAVGMTESDERIDLEASHSADSPRIRRIKLPHRQIEACAKLMRDACILAPVRDLIGPNLRLHTSKLNLKSSGYGAAVEWHQDWAFYPHTNDDILAVGVLLDDMTAENGALMMLPETHRGPIYNHHANGRFVGAINPEELDISRAESIIAPAGSISLHHVRLVHGSDINRSNRDRRLLLFEITAADAFPIMGALSKLPSIEEYDSRLLCGEGTLQPRLTPVPVRIPLPAPEDFGSIYELQSKTEKSAFERLGPDS